MFDKKCKNVYTLKGHLGGVRSLCQLKDGKLASGSADKTIEILKEYSNYSIKYFIR